MVISDIKICTGQILTENTEKMSHGLHVGINAGLHGCNLVKVILAYILRNVMLREHIVCILDTVAVIRPK